MYGDKMKMINEVYDKSNVYKNKFLPSSAHLILKQMEIDKVLDKSKLEEKVSNFYERTCRRNNNSNHYVDINSEAIKNYVGTRYIDNNKDLIEDLSDKESLLRMNKFLHNLKIEKDTSYALLHCFNELDRNVRNHSGIWDKDNKSYIYSANKYRDGEVIQINILDPGCGFDTSMRKLNVIDSVVEACAEGITAESNHDNASIDCQNSGYGLYMLHELSKLGEHKLEIISNNRYYFSKDGKGIMEQDIPFVNTMESSFTLVSITLDLNTLKQDLLKIQSKDTKAKSKKSMINYEKSFKLEEFNNNYEELISAIRQNTQRCSKQIVKMKS